MGLHRPVGILNPTQLQTDARAAMPGNGAIAHPSAHAAAFTCGFVASRPCGGQGWRDEGLQRTCGALLAPGSADILQVSCADGLSVSTLERWRTEALSGPARERARSISAPARRLRHRCESKPPCNCIHPGGGGSPPSPQLHTHQIIRREVCDSDDPAPALEVLRGTALASGNAHAGRKPRAVVPKDVLCQPGLSGGAPPAGHPPPSSRSIPQRHGPQQLGLRAPAGLPRKSATCGHSPLRRTI